MKRKTGTSTSRTTAARTAVAVLHPISTMSYITMSYIRAGTVTS